MFRNIFVLVSSLILWVSTKERFEQYRVYRLAVENVHQAMQLHSLESQSIGYDFWKSPAVGMNADIMVSPKMLADFEHLAKSLNINYTLKIENVQW